MKAHVHRNTNGEKTGVMKKVLIVLMAVVVVSCSSLTSTEKAEQQQQMAQAVDNALAQRRYKVAIGMMYPRNGRAVQVSSLFSLEVKGDTLVSYLPYSGRAYNVPYGGGKGLDFTAPITEYHASKNKKGTTQVSMKVHNDEDYLSFSMEIYNNGNAYVNLICREREAISYSGKLSF